MLDAARDCVLDFGVRRTTLTEVARRAGVSRPTIYRRWPDVSTLVADLITRELLAVFDSGRPALPTGTVRERVVSHMTATLTALSEHPLLARIIDVDPESLIAYIVQRLGTSQRMALEIISDGVRDGQSDGSIRAGDPAQLAAMLLLIGQSVVFSYCLVAELLPPGALAVQLRHVLEGYLRPDPGAATPPGAPGAPDPGTGSPAGTPRPAG